MATISNPFSIEQVTEMRKDGDTVSFVFSFICIMCAVLSAIFGLVYYFSLLKIYKDAMFVCFGLFGIFWFIVCMHRSSYLSDKRRKYKDLDKLLGPELEKALEKMTDKERDDYLDDLKNDKKSKGFL